MMDAIDLEAELNDLRHLTFVCRELIESKIRHMPRAPQMEGFITVLLNSDEVGAVMFLVGECECRARNLEKRFNAAAGDEGEAK